MDELKRTDPEIFKLIKDEERYEIDSIRRQDDGGMRKADPSLAFPAAEPRRGCPFSTGAVRATLALHSSPV